MNQQQLEARWLRGELPSVHYRFGEIVAAGLSAEVSASGRVVALLTLAPEPEYVIELPDGTSINAQQSALHRAT
jgi:hypothetical protein